MQYRYATVMATEIAMASIYAIRIYGSGGIASLQYITGYSLMWVAIFIEVPYVLLLHTIEPAVNIQPECSTVYTIFQLLTTRVSL